MSVRRALGFSLIERYLLLMLAFGSNIVIARLLTPKQIGVYSVSLAVVSITQVLRDFGVGSYLIQEKSLDAGQIRTAYGISLLLGTVLFAAVFVAAPFAAAYYAESRMTVTLRISALNFVLLPFSTVALALMRREMLFRQLLHIALSSAVAGAVISVGLSMLGFGENSLAAGAVATNLVGCVGAWLASPEHRFLKPGLSHWRKVLKFGGQSSLTGMITSISMDANDLIVGKVLGFQPVAILSRAQGLMSLFNRDLMAAIRNVALPAFAAAHREGQALQVPYARSVSLVTVFAWPFYGLVSIYAPEIVLLLFGRQWAEAAPLVPVFCLSGAIAAINGLTPNLLTAIGRIDLVTRGELLMQPLRVILVAVAAIGFRSITACAYAFVLSSAIALPVFWWFKNQGLGKDSTAFRTYVGSSALVSAVVLAPAVIHVFCVGLSRSTPIPLLQWLAVSALGTVLGLFAIARLKHPLEQEPIFRRISLPVDRFFVRSRAWLRRS